MGIPAGLLNRKVEILRRALVPSSPTVPRGGHTTTVIEAWAGYRPRGTTEITIGGLTLPATTGVVTLRDNPAVRAITPRDQVRVDGILYEILGQQLGEVPDGALRFDVRTAPSHEMYAQEFDARGEVVTLRRIVANAPPNDALVRAIITGYQPNEIAGGIQVGDRRVYLSAQDLEALDWPAPPRTNDRLLIRGETRVLTVQTVDDSTHRFAGELFVYDIRATG